MKLIFFKEQISCTGVWNVQQTTVKKASEQNVYYALIYDSISRSYMCVNIQVLCWTMYVYVCVCVLLLAWKISRRIYKKLLMVIKDEYQEITLYHYLLLKFFTQTQFII